MPSVSKNQQKFMGIVRSIQKGEEPSSKFSKTAQKAAKSMKKGSVRKYAKTKHDDLPTKKESVNKSDIKYQLDMSLDNLGIGTKALIVMKPKGKDFFLKMKSYMYQDSMEAVLKDANKNLDSKLKIKDFKKTRIGTEFIIGEAKRDYKDEYKKFQSSTKSKKYRAELNKYNRKKGTYGNGDDKDASHKGGKIVGFESQSKNRGRAEKSRLKKENDMPDFTPIIDEALDGLITEGARDPGIFKAIFLAGGPGSGKSYVAQQLFGIPKKVNVSKTGLKMVNSDSELEMLLKKYFGTTDIDLMPDELFQDLTGVDKAGKPVDFDTSGLRDFAKTLTKERLKLYTDGKLGVIIDGTGHKFGSLKAKRKKLADMGYDTYMIFVNTSLDIAMKRNEKRDRVVPEEIVRKSWQDVQNNMGAFQGLFGGSNFMIVSNNKHLSTPQANKHFKMLVEKGIDTFLKKPIKSKVGKAWMRREKKNQKVFKDPGQSKFFEHIEKSKLKKDIMKEHTVKFTKDDMSKLHNDGSITKKDPDGKPHKYVFKEKVLKKNPGESVDAKFSKAIDTLPNSKLTKDLVIKLAKKYKVNQNDALRFVSYSHLRDFGLKESDLGLTYKKGKTVKVKHKTSGKQLVIVDRPNVRKEYEKIGFFAEAQVNELTPPMSVSNPTAYKAMLDKQISKNVKVKTALGNKDHKDHKKAKSLLSRFMDKFKKKKDEPKKSKSTPSSAADFRRSRKENVNEAMGESQKFKIYNSLKKGDIVSIKYDSSIQKGSKYIPYVVTKGKTKLMKGKIERIILKSPKNPRFKAYLYNRDGDVSLALGDMAAVIVDMKKGKVSESVNENDKVKVLKLLIKKGDNPKDAKKDVEKFYNKVSKMYKKASIQKKAEIISSLSGKMSGKGVKSIKLKGKSGMGKISHFGMESVDEGEKRQSSEITAKFDKAYLNFAREVRDVISRVDRSTGDKTDGKIINKAYTKHLLPLDKLMQSWNKTQQKNPHIDESVNEAIEPSGIMAKISKIVQDKQAMKISGVLMDMFSASIMMRIYNAVNDKSKEQMNKGTMRQVQVILHKVMKQNKVRG